MSFLYSNVFSRSYSAPTTTVTTMTTMREETHRRSLDAGRGPRKVVMMSHFEHDENTVAKQSSPNPREWKTQNGGMLFWMNHQ